MKMIPLPKDLFDKAREANVQRIYFFIEPDVYYNRPSLSNLRLIGSSDSYELETSLEKWAWEHLIPDDWEVIMNIGYGSHSYKFKDESSGEEFFRGITHDRGYGVTVCYDLVNNSVACEKWASVLEVVSTHNVVFE